MWREKFPKKFQAVFQTFNIVVSIFSSIFSFGREELVEKGVLDAFDVRLKYQQAHPMFYLPFDLKLRP